MSVSKELAIKMIKELEKVNRDLVEEVEKINSEIDKNDELIQMISETAKIEDEDLFDCGDFKITKIILNDNECHVAEDECAEHSCCLCEHVDVPEDGEPCCNCCNGSLDEVNLCFYKEKVRN
jgi:hypothetical protein